MSDEPEEQPLAEKLRNLAREVRELRRKIEIIAKPTHPQPLSRANDAGLPKPREPRPDLPTAKPTRKDR